MKQHLLKALKLYGERMFFNLINMIMLPAFLPIITWQADEVTMVGIGSVLYSLMICSVYLGIKADRIWKVGKLDAKSYATEKYYPLKGFVLGLISEVPFFIHLILVLLFPAAGQLRSFYRLFAIGPYMGFVPASGANIGYFLVLLIAPILCGLFYYIGYNQKYKERDERLSTKIIYKTKK